jgi:hypothetical protein
VQRAVLTLVGLLLFFPVATWLVLRAQARRLGEALVGEAQALEARRFALAASARAGNVVDCLATAADAAPDVSRTLPWTHPEVRAIAEGRARWPSLAAPLAEEAARHRRWLLQVAGCAELSEVAPTDGVGPFPDFLHARRQAMPRLLDDVATLAPLAMSEALAQDRADDALNLCGAVLVHTSALTRLEGFEAMLPALIATRAVMELCPDAHASASAAARRAFGARAGDVLGLLPRYDEVLAVERVQQSLRLFGGFLPDDLAATLPPGARLVVNARKRQPLERGLLGTLATRLSWRRFDVGMREVERAARLPGTAALEAAQEGARSPLLEAVLGGPLVDFQYQLYADSGLRQRRLLETLLASTPQE